MYSQTDPPLSPRVSMPTMYDLPSESWEDGGLPDEFHWLQPELLRLTFRPPDYSDAEIFVGSDLNVYYDPRHPQWYKRPDWFAVLGTPRLFDGTELRLSYVVWQEGVDPFVAVELISPSTEAEDLGNTLRDVAKPPSKWQVYEQILRIPYYITFNRYTDEFQAFALSGGAYQPLVPDTRGFWLAAAKLGLGLWYGTFQGIQRYWLRWYDGQGQWILTPTETEQQRAESEKQRAEAEKHRAEIEQQRAEAEKQRADLAELELARLRQLLQQSGIDPSLPASAQE